MKERVSIRRTTQSGFLAMNREAMGKKRGAVFAIITAALREEPPHSVPARFSRQRPHRAG
jgi:hypothetical protein